MKTVMYKYSIHLAIAVLLLLGTVAGCAAPAAEEEQPSEAAPAAEEEQPSVAAPEQEVININFGTFWGGGHCQEVADLFTAWTEEASGGRLQFTVMPGDTAVPVDEHLDALADGVFDLNYMAEEYYQKEIPAFNILNGIPGMLASVEDGPRLARLGGWDDLRDRLYAEKNAVHVGTRPIGADAIISTVPLPSIDDVAGMKLRSTGLNAEVFTALGASTVFTPQDEVYVSLSSGLVDAAESGNAISQYGMGFHEVAKYWIQPNLTNCGMGLNLGANMDFWQSLSAADQALIERTFVYVGHVLNDDTMYKTGAVLTEVQEQHGVTVIYWGSDDLKKWADAYLEIMPKYPDDPYWAEGWSLIQDYAKVMGYA
ncbi:TRAP transporter substrate-binding protein DctP [Chloroflexota bacterium]